MERKHIKYLYIFLITLIILGGYRLYQGPQVKNEFTDKDLIPAEFTNDNYFYQLFALSEGPEVDIDSQEIKDKYKKLFYETKSNNRNDSALVLQVRANEKKYWSSNDFKELRMIDNVSYLGQFDINDMFKHREEYERAFTLFKPILDRFERLIFKEKVQDCLPYGRKWRYSSSFNRSYIPRLLIAKNVFKIMNENNWRSAVEDILQQIIFFKKLMISERSGQGYWTSLGFRYLYGALCTIAFLDDCPREIIRYIYEEIPVFQVEDINTKNKMVYSYLKYKDYLINGKYKNKFLTPKNRILSLGLFTIRNVLRAQQDLPYKNLDVIHSVNENMKRVNKRSEKMLNGYIVNFELRGYMLLESFRLMVLHDLLKIAVEYRLKSDDNLTWVENIEKLNSYKLLDPFTGHAYRINEKEKYLYSIGPDFKDHMDDPQSRRMKLSDSLLFFEPKPFIRLSW